MAIWYNFFGTSANERFDLSEYSMSQPTHVEGAGGNDYIAATDHRDILIGGEGDDVILGLEGNDTIYGDEGPNGAGGNDQLFGGGGDDVGLAGGGDDYVNGGDGDDMVDAGAGDDYVVGGLGADEVYGGAGNDILLGNGVPVNGPLPLLELISVNIDGIGETPIDPAEFFGGELGDIPVTDDDAADVLFGGARNDLLYGFGGNDQLSGGNNEDGLVGGLGNDRLDGGRGADYFVFAEYGKANFDKIAKFQKIDTIVLDTDVFTGIGKADSTLKKKYFHKGAEADGKNDKIIYDKKSGKLYYDQDGSGNDHGADLIAKIQSGSKIKADYIDLV